MVCGEVAPCPLLLAGAQQPRGTGALAGWGSELHLRPGTAMTLQDLALTVTNMLLDKVLKHSLPQTGKAQK